MARADSSDNFTVNLKMVDGRKLELNVFGTQLVVDLKRQVLECERLEGKAVKLIYQGKLLEDSVTLRDAGLHDACFVHCVFHDIVSNSHRNDDPEAEPPAISRFREMGFSDNEIEFFRMQLLSSGRGFHPNLMGNDAEVRRLEEDWLSNRVDLERGEPEPLLQARMDERQALEGDNSDLLWGISMGFLLGLVMVFWLWERALPRKQKIGILAGVGCNISFGLLRMVLSSFS